MRSPCSLAIVLFLSLPPAMAAEEESTGLTLGGDAWLRWEAAANFDLAGQSIAQGRRPERALSRIRPTLTLAPALGVSLLAQGQGYGGQASLYQAYADLTRGPLTVRAGRQEIVLGSGFLLGADTFFDGASFDAVRVTYRARGDVTLDAFGGRYVEENSGGVEGSLYGAVVGARALQAYAMRDTGGALVTDTLALRAQLARGPLRLELEPSRQRDAWGGHAEATYTFQAEGEPSLTASYALAARGFRHPNNDTGQVGDIGLFGDLSCFESGEAEASGLSALSLNADLPLGARTRLSSTLRAFRADSVTGAASRRLGREIDLVLSRTLSARVSVTASANRFHGERFFRECMGRPLRILYGYVGVELSF